MDSVDIRIEEWMGDHTISFKVKAHKGINRNSWRFTFPVTEDEKAGFKAHLNWTINDLETRVDKKKRELHQKLATIEKQLDSAKDVRSLNAVRRDLIADFNVYAGGPGYFGDRLNRFTAPAGEYKVTVEVDGKVQSTKIEVREDPLLKK